MDKKRMVLFGGALASAGAIAFFAARHHREHSDPVRHAQRAELAERNSGEDEASSQTKRSDGADHASVAKPAEPKADPASTALAQSDSTNAAPARAAAPATSDEIRAAAEAVHYVPLEPSGAAREADKKNSADAAQPQRPELEPAVLNGDRATQIRQYVAMQQSIERASSKLQALPEGDPARAKLTAFVTETQAQLAEADGLLESKKPTQGELASARAELARLTAQAKPMKGPGG